MDMLRDYPSSAHQLNRFAALHEFSMRHFEHFCGQAARLMESGSQVKGVNVEIREAGKPLVVSYLDRRVRVNPCVDYTNERGVLHIESLSRCADGSERGTMIEAIRFNTDGSTDLPGGCISGTTINLGVPADCAKLAANVVLAALAVNPWEHEVEQ